MEDTTIALWDILYKVKIPYLQTCSVDYIRQFGTPTTGHDNLDKEMNNQYIVTYINIEKMVDFHRQGIPVRVLNYNETEDIYKAINAHLLAWRTQLEHGINIGDAPVEDLIAMDEFANSVYEHAGYFFTKSQAESLLSMALHKTVMFTPANFFKNTKLSNGDDGIVRINPVDENTLEKRESHSEIFKNRIFSFKTSLG